MISVDNLHAGYSGNHNVISGLNVDFSEKHIHGIVGLNGSGKTTFLNTLFGLLNPQSGKILYRDKVLSKKEMAYLPTENFFYTNITGNEYLNLITNTSFDTHSWNQLFALPLHELIDSYSTGMKKKLALLGVLKQDKPIIILDEPFNGLDIEAAHVLQMILQKMKLQGKTIIITSHIIQSLTYMCDFIHLLEKGKITQCIASTHFHTFEKELLENIAQNNLELIDLLTQK